MSKSNTGQPPERLGNWLTYQQQKSKQDPLWLALNKLNRMTEALCAETRAVRRVAQESPLLSQSELVEYINRKPRHDLPVTQLQLDTMRRDH